MEYLQLKITLEDIGQWTCHMFTEDDPARPKSATTQVSLIQVSFFIYSELYSQRRSASLIKKSADSSPFFHFISEETDEYCWTCHHHHHWIASTRYLCHHFRPFENVRHTLLQSVNEIFLKFSFLN